MFMQIIHFESTRTEAEVLATAHDRAPQFRAIPGLVQKHYIKLDSNHFGGVYIWDSKESMLAYRESELAATIPAAYGVQGAPSVISGELLFSLREDR